MTAAIAAFASTTLSLPLWATFIGWVACFIMSLRVIPIANNILSYFLGLIGYFASHLEPALSTFLEPGTFAFGSFAAWIASTIESRLTRAAATGPVFPTPRRQSDGNPGFSGYRHRFRISDTVLC